MNLVIPNCEITFHAPEGYSSMERFLEEVGRTPYKSEESITDDSADEFITKLVKNTHWAMIEHCVATVRFIADRGFSHELVRHRLASFAQESTRFVNYTKAKQGGSINIIELPDVPGMTEELRQYWQDCAADMEEMYFTAERMAKAAGIKKPAQIARMWLPIGIKTEIVMTANLREWNTVFGLRADTPAHPIIKGLTTKVLRAFYEKIPTVYGPVYRWLTPPDMLTEAERAEALSELMSKIRKLEKRARALEKI